MRWLRPDVATEQQQATVAVKKAAPKRGDAVAWPSDPFDQMAAVMAAARLNQGDFSVEDLAASFKRAPPARALRSTSWLSRNNTYSLAAMTADSGLQRLLREFRFVSNRIEMERLPPGA